MFRTARSLRLMYLLPCLALLGTEAGAADLVVGSRTEPASLDPQHMWGQITTQFNYHYLGFMTRKGPDGKLIPSLGLKWAPTGDNEWVFDMDPDAKFSNGAPVTASDAIASYQRAIDLPTSSYKGLFAVVQRFEAVDDHTLKVSTTKPYPILPSALSQVPIIPKSIAERATSKDFMLPEFQISAGPYIFSKYAPGDQLSLVRNPTYRGPQAKWDKVTFRFLSDPAARVAALLSGAVDMIDGVTPDDAAELAKRSDLKVVTAASERTVFMTYDLSRDVTPQVRAIDGSPLATNPFKDLRIRKALAYAINREAIVSRVLLNQGAVMNQIGTPKQGGYNPEIAQVPYDPEMARKLIAEAGYPKGFAITITCPSGFLVNDARVCQALGQMLERIGLKITVDVVPYPVLATKIICHCAERPSFFMATWSSAYAGEVGPALSNVIHSYDKSAGKATWNLGEYSNPELDKMIDQAAETLDEKARFRLEADAMKIAMDDFAILPLHLQGVALVSRKGITPTPFSNEYTLADYMTLDK